MTWLRLPYVLVLGLLVGGPGLLVGCDSGGSKRASQYQNLTGTWTLQALRPDLPDPSVEITFEKDGDGRRYSIRHIASGDTSSVDGRAEVLRENTLSMVTGFDRPLTWRFTFEEPNDVSTSVRFSLIRDWEGSSQAFLASVGISGGARRIEMDLVR